jgi:hypothetical protein
MSQQVEVFRRWAGVRLALAAALGLGAWGAAAPRACVADEGAVQLFQLARRSVVRLVVERDAEPGEKAAPGRVARAGGSAVVVVAEPPGAPQSLTLATAYHVMAGAKRFTVQDHSDVVVASSGPDTECFIDRSREVAFVRVKVEPGKGKGLGAINHEKAEVDSDGRPGARPTGMAFGFPYVPGHLDSRRVDFLGAVPADALGLVRKTAFSPGKGQIPPITMPFQLLGDQATLEGMSGGLAVDQKGRFAGLVYGRRTDQFNLLIPADQVLEVWRQARAAREANRPWERLGGGGPFQQPSLFNGGSGDADGMIEDRLDWGTLEGLTVLLGDDPLDALQRFQEIVVIPPRRSPPPDLHIYVPKTETTPNAEHKLTLWVNGKKADFDPLFRRFTLPLRDLPGETMLTVIKESGRINDFELGKLLLPSKVYLVFQYEGEEPFRRVVRSLPAITQSYPLFITVVNDPRVGARSSKERPDNARLALRLDYAQAVLNQAPFSLEVSHKDADTAYEGRFRLEDRDAWHLRAVSPQRLGVRLNGEVVIPRGEKLRYRGVTLEPRPGPDSVWPPKFTLSGRIQFPYEMPGRDTKGNTLSLAVSARATGANGSGSLRVDVSPPLQADIAGLVRHLFTCYFNSVLISTLQVHGIDDEKITPFLERLGFASPAGWVPEIRRAVLVRDPARQQEWLILTFRLDPKAGGAGGDPPAGYDLLAPPQGEPGRVISLDAWGVPGSVAARFPGLNKGNPATAAALETARAQHVSLTMELGPKPSEWFTGLGQPGELLLLRDNGVKVGQRIQKAIEHSVSCAKAVELRAEADPGFALEVLRTALKRPDLKLTAPSGKASLRVVARQGGGAADVVVTLAGGPLMLTTPGEEAVPLGGGSTVRGGCLKVSRLEARGRIDGAAVNADVDAELSVKQLKAGGDTFDDVKARLTLTLDTAPGSRGLGSGTIEGAEFTGQLAGIRTHFRVEGKVPVEIDRELNVKFDPAALKGGKPR